MHSNNQFLSKKIKSYDIDFTSFSYEDINEAYEILISKSQDEFNQKLNSELTEFSHFFGESSSDLLLSLHGFVSSMNSLMEDNKLRAIEEHYSPVISQKFTEWSLSENIYNKLLRFSTSDNFNNLPTIRKKMVNKILKDLSDSGVNLPKDKKDELATLKSKLVSEVIKFQNNITDAQSELNLTFNINDLGGLSERSLNLIHELSKEKNLPVGTVFLDEPSGTLGDAIKNCDNENVRKTIYMLKRNICHGGKYDNSKIIDSIYKTKQDIANILGYKNHAEMTLVDNMAKTPDNALRFITEIGNLCLPYAKNESSDLRKFCFEKFGKKMQWWDQEFISKKYLSENYNLDSEAIRKYFPTNAVMCGLFKTIEGFFDVRFVENKNKSTWHKDVVYYDVYESDNHIGGLFVDLFKRSGKSPGAWLNPICSYEDNDLSVSKPYALLVCNVNKDVSGNSTLEIDDIITLFHEMGHALHHLLSKVPEEYYSGFNNVEHDAVEIPSQLFENFVYLPSILKELSTHIETSERIPEFMIDSIIRSKKFLGASSIIGMVRFSQMDLKLYNQIGEHPYFFESEATEQWKIIEDYDKDRKRMPLFSHIFGGGYSAGYYSYQWAEVYAADGYNYLIEHQFGTQEFQNRINKYKEHILYTGGLDSMIINYQKFKGSEPDKSHYLNLYI